LIIAPRHPERFGYVEQLLREQQLSFVTRTSGAMSAPQTQVLLLNTLGELRYYYAACDVAFVGGSLVPVGGHNLLEPAALAKPIIAGSHLFNTEDIASMLEKAGAVKIVDDANGLADWAIALFEDADARARAGQAGLQVVDYLVVPAAALLVANQRLISNRSSADNDPAARLRLMILTK